MTPSREFLPVCLIKTFVLNRITPYCNLFLKAFCVFTEVPGFWATAVSFPFLSFPLRFRSHVLIQGSRRRVRWWNTSRMSWAPWPWEKTQCINFAKQGKREKNLANTSFSLFSPKATYLSEIFMMLGVCFSFSHCGFPWGTECVCYVYSLDLSCEHAVFLFFPPVLAVHRLAPCWKGWALTEQYLGGFGLGLSCPGKVRVKGFKSGGSQCIVRSRSQRARGYLTVCCEVMSTDVRRRPAMSCEQELSLWRVLVSWQSQKIQKVHASKVAAWVKLDAGPVKKCLAGAVYKSFLYGLPVSPCLLHGEAVEVPVSRS